MQQILHINFYQFCFTRTLFRHNILLDGHFNPKVADFGFVTLLPRNVGSTSVITVAGSVSLAGTRGYLPPEYVDGKRGAKSDVYSYGIVRWLI